MINKNNWWNDLYDDLLEDMLLERASEEETERTLDFIVRHLKLAPGARVFDQCCGNGSLALPLANRGFELHGADQAKSYIEKANALASEKQLNASFVAADAFQHVAEPCAGAFNWWTSFGYANDDETNLLMLQRAYESLEAGGTFLLDTMNLPGVFRHFQRDVVTERQTRRGEVTLHRRSRFDLEAGRILKTWTYHVPGEDPVVHDTSVRLYLPSSLCDMLRNVGFDEVTLLGDLDDTPLNIDHMRCICVAKKAGAA